MEILKDIEKISKELKRRVVQRNGGTYIQATKAEVHALRMLSARLEHVFGVFANVDFGGEGE
jgi:hypothetical protein